MATSTPNSDMGKLLDYSVDAGNDVIHNFEAQNITAEIVSNLSDVQPIQLGLKTLEKQLLVRSLCKNSSTRNAKLALFSLRLS